MTRCIVLRRRPPAAALPRARAACGRVPRYPGAGAACVETALEGAPISVDRMGGGVACEAPACGRLAQRPCLSHPYPRQRRLLCRRRRRRRRRAAPPFDSAVALWLPPPPPRCRSAARLPRRLRRRLPRWPAALGERVVEGEELRQACEGLPHAHLEQLSAAAVVTVARRCVPAQGRGSCFG